MSGIRVMAASLLLLVATSAWATDRYVPGGGSPSYPTITAAIAASSPNDVIHVAGGVYPETITIPHSLRLLGAGAATTSIDVSGNPAAGNVITISGLASASVEVTGFKIVTGPASAVASNAVSVSGIGAGSINFNNNELWCVQAAAPAMDNFGFIGGYNTGASLWFVNNLVYGGGSNPVLLELWQGPVEFYNNEIRLAPYDGGACDAVFVMNYGSADITTLQAFDNNWIDLGGGTTYDYANRSTGITICAQYTGGAGPGGFTNVEIAYNDLVNLKPSRRGIGLWDNSSGPGDVIALIEGNRISAAPGFTGEYGIRLLGGITGTTMTLNDISGTATGIKAQPYGGGSPAGFSLHQNNLGGNTAGFDNQTTATIDATCNWWGSLLGPNLPPGNPSPGAPILGGAVYAPWLDAASSYPPAPPGGACTQYGANQVAPVTTGLCVSTAHPCVTVPVVFTRADVTAARGVSVTFTLSSELALCSTPAASIRQGGWLAGYGTNYQVVANLDGSYTVDQAILGLPCGVTTGGPLFTLDLKAAGGDGTGTVTVTAMDARDCMNNPLPGIPGAPGTIPVDQTAPAAPTALAAAQWLTGNDSDGTTKITVSWPAVEAGATVRVYRAGFGNYPEYNDPPAAGAVPATPSYPPGAPWVSAGNVAAPGTSLVDDPGTRDFWYYVAFVEDACGNVSAVSNKTGGTLSYHLGDVHNGLADCTGNNTVATEDISFLGAHYAITLMPSDVLGCLDVGPTTTHYVDGRPLTDNKVNFDDLMMFAINHGQVSAPQDAPQAVAVASDELWLEGPAKVVAGATFAVSLRMRGAGDLQGLSAQLGWDHAVAEPVSVEAGPLAAMQNGVVFSGGVGQVDAALLGANRGFAGEGVLATVTFRALASGAPGVVLAKLDARDQANRPVALAGVTPAVPVATWFAPAMPNPFRGTTVLSYALAKAGAVELAVYGVDGRKVAVLASGVQAAGTYRLTWDGAGARPGLYYARLTTPEGRFNRTLVLTK